MADRLAAWLVYLALAGAAITYLLTRDLTATIAVIVVAGACRIAAGTPLAVLAAIARIAQTGAFVKDGAHLEALSTVDTIVFDKTGTLTTGTPTVVGDEVFAGSINQVGAVEIRAERVGTDSSYGRIIAAFIHVGSETAFILNSARLIPGRHHARR